MQNQNITNEYIIIIQNLCLEWWIGVYAHEQDKPQLLEMDFRLTAFINGDPKADDYAKVPCYDQLVKDITAFSKQGRFGLLERLGHEVADICLQHSQITAVTLSIHKPEALAGRSSFGDALVGVEITREKD